MKELITLSLIKTLSELSAESLKEWKEKTLEMMSGKPAGERYIETVLKLVRLGGIKTNG